MKSPDNIHKTFSKIRDLPVEVSSEQVEQFVLANVAAGTLVATAGAKSFGLKALLVKFHLNSIVAMTTIASASVLGLIIAAVSWTGHKTADTKKNLPAQQIATRAILAPQDVETIDTPAVATQPAPNTTSTTTVVAPGKTVTITTVNTGAGSNTTVAVTATDDSVVVVNKTEVDTTDGKTDYVYTYGYDKVLAVAEAQAAAAEAQAAAVLAHQQALQTLIEMPPLPEQPMVVITPPMSGQMPCMAYTYSGCRHPNDTLLKTIESNLLKDGLIKDGQHYSFHLEGKSLKINGETQQQEVFEKYKNLYQEATGRKFGKHDEYKVEKDGDNVSIRQEAE